MRQKHGSTGSAEKHVKEIKRKTRRQYSAEEKIRIVPAYNLLVGLKRTSRVCPKCD